MKLPVGPGRGLPVTASEGQLKRGPSPQDTYYDTVDLQGSLHKGKNTVAVLVWYFGKHGFSHNNSGKAGLLFDASIDGKPILSDASWKVRAHPAYGSTDPPHPNFRLPEPNIRFDARSDIPDWFAQGYNDRTWEKSTPFGKPPAGPWNHLHERPIAMWKDSGLVDYVTVTSSADANGIRTVTGLLPYNAHVTPYLEIEAPAGKTIDIRTDHYNNMPNGPTVRAEYITREGLQTYESLGWMNGHVVRYTIPAGVTVRSVKYRETGYQADEVGSFRCDVPALNTLWEKAKRTLYVTMRDTYMDCPDRERAQWWGDAVNELGEAFYVYDARKGPLLAKKGIYELARWQRSDKVLYSPVPAGLPSPDNRGKRVRDGSYYRELPRQMLASVGWYGFWTYYLYTADQQTIADVYPAVRDYLSLWALGQDGLVVHRPGDWDWTDWGTNKDVPVLENAWLHLALKAAVEMARLTGNEQDIPDYQARMQSIASHFNPAFWQGDRYHSPGYDGETDDRANAMAVVAGLARAQDYPAICRILEQEFHASPYMEKYVLESLYLMRAPHQAVARMNERFETMINAPITTLYENFGGGQDRAGFGTYNHAWSGGALTCLSQYAAGIAPTQPGYTQFSVRPQMGPLRFIESVVPTPHGSITLTLAKNRGSLEMGLHCPAGTEALVGVPVQEDMDSVLMNRQRAWSKQGIHPVSDASYVGREATWIVWKVKPGDWQISVH